RRVPCAPGLGAPGDHRPHPGSRGAACRRLRYDHEGATRSPAPDQRFRWSRIRASSSTRPTSAAILELSESTSSPADLRVRGTRSLFRRPELDPLTCSETPCAWLARLA